MGWDPVGTSRSAGTNAKYSFQNYPQFLPLPSSLSPHWNRIGLHLSLYVFEGEEGDDNKCEIETETGVREREAESGGAYPVTSK